jgi:hypothetical protein
MSNWSAVESQFQIGSDQRGSGVAGHHLLVLKDPAGNVVGEIEGLATVPDLPQFTLPQHTLVVSLAAPGCKL